MMVALEMGELRRFPFLGSPVASPLLMVAGHG